MTACEHTVELSDGRSLRASECGRRNGTPILFFHGTGHCRLGRHPDDAIAQRVGVRLVAIDRPGLGGSSHQRGRRLLDWAADVEELVDALGMERFGILAWSGGGPYALACAHELPKRVASATIVGSLAPVDRTSSAGMPLESRLLLTLASLSPLAVCGPMTILRLGMGFDAERLLSALYHGLPPCDRAILEDDEIRATFVAAAREVLSGGTRGLVDEMRLITRSWDFELEDVRPPIAVWHGDADHVVPLTMGRYLSDHLPSATLRVLPAEGHQLIWPRWAELLGDLARATLAAGSSRRSPRARRRSRRVAVRDPRVHPLLD